MSNGQVQVAKPNFVWATAYQAPAVTAQETVAAIVDKLPTLKNLAQSLLGCVWFLQNLKPALKVLYVNTDVLGSSLEWVAYLKPFEKAFLAIKHVGNFFEFPERIVGFKNIKAEWIRKEDGTPTEKTNRWKAAYRITSAFYIGLDAIVLIPLKYGLWNLLAIGNWAAKVGVTPFGLGVVRDVFTATSSAINVVAESINRTKAEKVIAACHKKINNASALSLLKEKLKGNDLVDLDLMQKSLVEKEKIVQKTPALLAEIGKLKYDIANKEASLKSQLQEIDALKASHWTTSFGEGPKASKAKMKTDTEGKLLKFEKAKAELIQEKEKMVQEQKTSSTSEAVKIAKLESEIRAVDRLMKDGKEKIARIRIWGEQTTAENLGDLREILSYKFAKVEVLVANKKTTVDKATATRWYDIAKFSVVVFTNLILLGVATVVAPTLGLSAVTIGSIFFIGQWITGFGCGLAGLRRTYLMFRYDKPIVGPQTHLLHA